MAFKHFVHVIAIGLKQATLRSMGCNGDVDAVRPSVRSLVVHTVHRMSDRKIRQRIADALGDAHTKPEQVESVRLTILGNLQEASRQLTQSYVSFLTVAASLTLIVSSQVTELAVFGAKLRLDVVSVLAPLLAGFFFYRFMCFAAFTSLLFEASLELHERAFQPFHRNLVTALLHWPEVFYIESFLDDLSSSSKFQRVMNQAALLLMAVMLFVAPAVWLGWATYVTVVQAKIAIAWRVGVGIAVLVFLIRSLGFWNPITKY